MGFYEAKAKRRVAKQLLTFVKTYYTQRERERVVWSIKYDRLQYTYTYTHTHTTPASFLSSLSIRVPRTKEKTIALPPFLAVLLLVAPRNFLIQHRKKGDDKSQVPDAFATCSVPVSSSFSYTTIVVLIPLLLPPLFRSHQLRTAHTQS